MSTPSEVRAHAAHIVSQVADRGRSLDTLLVEEGSSAQERGLLRSLCYGTVRWHVRLSALLKALLNQPAHKLDPEIRALSLVGLFQLLHTDIPAHAVIAETVEGVRVLRQPRATGLVNAILRRAQREAASIMSALDADLAVRTAHPDWLVNALTHDWSQDAVAVLEANNAHPPFWLRVNRRKCTREEYLTALRAQGIEAQLSQLAPDALLLATAVDVRALPGFSKGLVSVQDAAAQLAAPLLEPRPGQRVLDACAAPGGKTCHLLELQPELQELVALDVASPRLVRVRENLARLGLAATLMEADASDTEEWWDGKQFDRILLDVPCSATGVIRRHPDIKLLRRADDIPTLSAKQKFLLEKLWPLLAPGGRLLYASCSALRAENGDVVNAFLSDHADARITKPASLGLSNSSSIDEPGLRIRVGEAGLDGFYYACLDKNASA